ncbi:MAG: winged helix-turn-helix domain-containing protein [Acidobacteriota bacterium]|nr:winged helix-turn-helix domain-containing protein [Acidobacteriota bacterium]
MSGESNHLYEFGLFRLDTAKRRLSRDGRTVPLTSKVFDILLVLIQRSGRVVEKDELMKEVWPDSFVAEANLTQNISVLRKALGEGSNGEEFIQTVPKRGYCFVTSVREVPDQAADLTFSGQLAAPNANPTDDENVLTRNTESAVGIEQSIKPDAHRPSDEQRRESKWSQRPTFLALAILLLGLTAAFTYSWISGEENTGKKSEWQSLAVLPFKHVSDESIDEALELGMADALIARLSHIGQINVRPTRAILKYTERGQDLLDAGHELGVDAVLDGTVQKSGNRVRVTVQLVSVRDGKHLWSETFDEKWTNIFALQDAVSNQVAQSLALQVNKEERVLLTRRYTENAEAYEAYIKGRYFWNKKTAGALKKAIDFYESAVEKDPGYALAYAGLADAYHSQYIYGQMSEGQTIPKARAAALKALEIDDTLAEAHASLAPIKWIYDWDYAGTEREFKRAIELNPNYATTHHWYALYLMERGRHDEAIIEIKRASQLDPLSIMIRTDVGLVLSAARQYDQAVAQLRETLEMDPNFFETHHLLGQTYIFQGKYSEALAEYRKMEESGGPVAGVKGEIAYAHARLGQTDRALALLHELRERNKSSADLIVPQQVFAHIGLGNRDEALNLLENMVVERNIWIRFLDTYPLLDDLRSDPRFAELLSQVRSYQQSK